MSNITQKLVETKVAKRIKRYDGKCPGFYVSLSPTAPPTFFLKYTDLNTHKRCTVRLGTYHAETFDIVRARTEAMHLKARIGRGEDVAQTKRQTKALQATLSGVTVDQIIDERIAWMSTLVRKADGEMRARKESWKNTASHLDRFVRPRLGRRIASEVTKHDIAKRATTSSTASSASHRSAMPAMCAARCRPCSTGPLKQAAIMSPPAPA
jgi:hypothetical protein